MYDFSHIGDIILADRGFTCDEYARMAMAEIKTPPFTKGKKQLEKIQIDWSRELSLVRIMWSALLACLSRNIRYCRTQFPFLLFRTVLTQNPLLTRL